MIKEFGNARLCHSQERLMQQLEPVHLGALHLNFCHAKKPANVSAREFFPAQERALPGKCVLRAEHPVSARFARVTRRVWMDCKPGFVGVTPPLPR